MEQLEEAIDRGLLEELNAAKRLVSKKMFAVEDGKASCR